MDEQKQAFNWKRLLITTLLVLVASGAVGGGVYYGLNQNFKKEREASEKALQDLQTQVKKSEETTKEASLTSLVSVRTADLNSLTAENNSMGKFLDPIYSDLTGDDKEEAVLTFVYDGTGGIKDFFIFSVVNNQIKQMYSKKGLGKAQISVVNVHQGENPVVKVTWIDPNDPENQNRPNSDMVVTSNTSKQYKWNGNIFIENYIQ